MSFGRCRPPGEPGVFLAPCDFRARALRALIVPEKSHSVRRGTPPASLRPCDCPLRFCPLRLPFALLVEAKKGNASRLGIRSRCSERRAVLPHCQAHEVRRDAKTHEAKNTCPVSPNDDSTLQTLRKGRKKKRYPSDVQKQTPSPAFPLIHIPDHYLCQVFHVEHSEGRKKGVLE